MSRRSRLFISGANESPKPNTMAISIPVLPESAPFTPAQRSWLNGFLAGLLNVQPGSNGTAARTASTDGAASANSNGVAVAEAPVDAGEEDYPWHDAALSLEERLKLAEGKPYARRLM